jgi:catechol 2,3-dioxygenase-like lactoylglutathione lyase family enzyme
MISTHGLTHLALAVRDPDRSLRFYAAVFGVREYFRDANTIQVLGPGPGPRSRAAAARERGGQWPTGGRRRRRHLNDGPP